MLQKHNHLHRMRSENILWNVTQISGRVYQTTTKANRRKKRKKPRGETMSRPSNWREWHRKTDNLWTKIYTNKNTKIKTNWAAGVVLPVGASPPHNGPRCERCVRVSRFCVWMYGPGVDSVELTSEISNFQRMSFLDCAACAKSADEWVYVWMCERESKSACDWLECVSGRAECGRMWRVTIEILKGALIQSGLENQRKKKKK